jgi:hypothetical protein
MLGRGWGIGLGKDSAERGRVWQRWDWGFRAMPALIG